MTLRCKFTHRWRPVTIPLVGLMIAVLTVITARSTTARNPDAAGDSPLAPQPKAVIQPVDGATEVNPVSPIRVSVTGGAWGHREQILGFVDAQCLADQSGACGGLTRGEQ